MHADWTRQQTTRYSVNAEFNHAILFFADSSYLELEHTSRENRWAKASKEESVAGGVCRAMRQFRLNAKHLQLFFTDGSDVEFFAGVDYDKSD